MATNTGKRGSKFIAVKRATIQQSMPKKNVPVVRQPRTAPPVMAPFGGVSQVAVAPVSVGNTVRSVKQHVIPTRLGVRVLGRDYVMTVGGTSAAYSGWTLQGGMPLSPIGLNASGLRGYFQTYEKFVWHRCVAHYITSSPTSLAGDVLMVHHTNTAGPKVDHTSNNFLSYALSTDSALIGPQWTNHSVEILQTTTEKLDTDVLNNEDVQHQSAGELLVYTKNTTNVTQPDPPGYILIDYDIEFQIRMLNPRILTLPTGVFKRTPSAVSMLGPVTAWDKVQLSVGTNNTYSGANSVKPTGDSIGLIYQVVFDLQNAVFSGSLNIGSISTMWSVVAAQSGIGGTASFQPLFYGLSTGTTVYAVSSSANSATAFDFYPSYDAVFSGSTLRWNTTSANQGMTVVVSLICVGSITANLTQANIG